MYLYTVSAEFANPAMAADGCSGSRVGTSRMSCNAVPHPPKSSGSTMP